MATVASGVGARIDHFLEYLSREWESVPKYAEEFPTWDDVEQLAFVHEWDVRESALRVLRDYAEVGAMTLSQCACYGELLGLVARYRSALERLLGD